MMLYKKIEPTKNDTLKIEYNIPTWAICALEYGDFSGLNDEEERQVNAFVKHLETRAQGRQIIYGWSESEYFSWHNDLHGLGATVNDCTVVFLAKHEGGE